jgi:hypothetical protein
MVILHVQCSEEALGWHEEISEGGKPNRSNEAENDCRYYLTLGTLWSEIRATIHLMHAASRTLLEIAFKMKHTRRINSSVEIDVIESSRVVRSEHLLEFLFSYALRC